ncbi:xylan 1,4-beta-xylosidase [Actinomadura sp. PM05-2]|uniref:Xylan 1,4-beta-xylosidase n=1 Tax=Actinomadura parmotrematis TaxID=2864039 RepID=A0ABS7FW02_9ACTN|nr:xylan 1,4-beta-xylosidase [Actinomadura parmotrematis]
MFLVALVAALAGVLTSLTVLAVTGRLPGGGAPAAAPAAPASRVAPGAPAGWPAWGFTHTQNSVDPRSGPAQALADIGSQPVPQAVPIMGWGVDNPEPRKGGYNWGTLDRRMQAVRQTRGVPVVTLCCSPDWMKGGAPGTTDWSKLEKPVDRAHFDDFAALAAEVARRYPDVRYYAVWNEFKGFWNQAANRWDYEGYTDLYNKVYAALKKVDSDIRVGGPYMVLNSSAPGVQSSGPPSELAGPWGSMDQRDLDALKYWYAHKKGADFLAVDGASLPQQPGARVDEFTALRKFSDATRWLRGLDGGLPVWWAEWYVEPAASGWTDEHRGAVQAVAMMEFIEGGASSAFYWNPQGADANDCAGCLWYGSAHGGGGTPTLQNLQSFGRWFPPGTPLVRARSSNPAVRVLAQPHRMVAVNTSAQAASARIDGATLTLAPYEVKWAAR